MLLIDEGSQCQVCLLITQCMELILIISMLDNMAN